MKSCVVALLVLVSAGPAFADNQPPQPKAYICKATPDPIEKFGKFAPEGKRMVISVKDAETANKTEDRVDYYLPKANLRITIRMTVSETLKFSFVYEKKNSLNSYSMIGASSLPLRVALPNNSIMSTENTMSSPDSSIPSVEISCRLENVPADYNDSAAKVDGDATVKKVPPKPEPSTPAPGPKKGGKNRATFLDLKAGHLVAMVKL